MLSRSARLPDRVDLEKAAEISEPGQESSNSGWSRRVGRNGTELEKIAELLAAPIVKALLGKAAVPDDSPYTTGGIGLLGTKPSQEAMEDCDTLLMVGTSFPTSSSCRNRTRPGECRLNWIPNALACDIRSKLVWWATVAILYRN